MKVRRKRRPNRVSTPPKEFIVMNDEAQVWMGLIAGKPVFSDNFDDAKPLSGVEKFDTLQQVHFSKLEKIWLD